MKTVLVVLGIMLMTSTVMAQSPITLPTELSAKQGMVENFEGNLQNTTTFEALKTRPIEKAPAIVNLIWDGNSVDLGFAYDANSADNAVLLISRHINNWADYLPIVVPEAVKILDISANLGVEVQHFSTSPKWTGCGGFSYLKANIKF